MKRLQRMACHLRSLLRQNLVKEAGQHLDRLGFEDTRAIEAHLGEVAVHRIERNRAEWRAAEASLCAHAIAVTATRITAQARATRADAQRRIHRADGTIDLAAVRMARAGARVLSTDRDYDMPAMRPTASARLAPVETPLKH